MNKKTKILVLCGGESPEHEVSLLSGKNCCINFDKKYIIQPVVILKNGRWIFGKKFAPEKDKNKIGKWFDNIISETSKPDSEELQSKSLFIYEAIEFIHNNKPDLVFFALHGTRGEDGTVQGLFEFLRIPYTASGVLASSLSMDKHRFQKLLAYHGIYVPPQAVLFEHEEYSEEFADKVEKTTGFPCFVKPSRSGSSVGMSIAKERDDLEKSVRLALKYDREILVEKFIKGTEVTCGIISALDKDGKNNVIVLKPTEIVPKEAEFFDYQSKYTAGKTDEITPARLPESTIKMIQETTEKVFRLAGGRGFSRVDMIISNGTPYVLEINTIPGMTPMSLLPKGAKASGISFPKLLDEIVVSTLNFFKN